MARMWEARCAPGQTDAAVEWVRAQVVPSALSAGASTAQVFVSADRVVLLTRWPVAAGWCEPVPPAAVQRCHGWEFQELM